MDAQTLAVPTTLRTQVRSTEVLLIIDPPLTVRVADQRLNADGVSDSLPIQVVPLLPDEKCERLLAVRATL